MNKTELKEALIAMTIATSVPVSTNAASNTQTPPEKVTANSTQSNNLERSVNIKEISPQGRTTTRHVYNWQEVAQKYYLETSDYSKGAKLPKEQELECAAVLKAIARYEAGNPSAIEDKYYHDNLQGKLTDAQCQAKIESAKDAKEQKTFTQIIAEERAILENNKDARKKALKELEEFRNMNDMNKGITLTDKVDARIEQNNENSKTLSAALFMRKLNERS